LLRGVRSGRGCGCLVDLFTRSKAVVPGSGGKGGLRVRNFAVRGSRKPVVRVFSSYAPPATQRLQYKIASRLMTGTIGTNLLGIYVCMRRAGLRILRRQPCWSPKFHNGPSIAFPDKFTTIMVLIAQRKAAQIHRFW
jgi:hypothetical protein